MLRAAWRMRCSFSTSAMRTWSSPCSPKPMPGATATSACSISSLENSSEPRCRNGSGIGAQANIDAAGAGIGPAGAAEGIDHHVAALVVDVAHFGDVGAVAVQRGAAATWIGVKAP